MNPFYYTLELNKYDECPLEKVNNLQTDPRYNYDEIGGTYSSFEIDYWSFVRKNGVAQILLSLPSYWRDAGVTTPEKSSKPMKMNWRNTIPWSLQCELEGESRLVGYR